MSSITLAINEALDSCAIVNNCQFFLSPTFKAFVGESASIRLLTRYDSSSLKYTSLSNSGAGCGISTRLYIFPVILITVKPDSLKVSMYLYIVLGTTSNCAAISSIVNVLLFCSIFIRRSARTTFGWFILQ